MYTAKNSDPAEVVVENGTGCRRLWMTWLKEKMKVACKPGKPGQATRAARRCLLDGEAEQVAAMIGLDPDALIAAVGKLQESGWTLPDRLRGRCW